MASRAVSRCLVFLESTEGLCVETELLRDEILTTQSDLALELLGWHELLDDLDRCIVHAHKVAHAG